MSVKCKDASSHEAAWHLGIIKNISDGGLVVEAHFLKPMRIASNVELIYFPQKDKHTTHLTEPEPVKRTGQLVWQNTDYMNIGIQFHN